MNRSKLGIMTRAELLRAIQGMWRRGVKANVGRGIRTNRGRRTIRFRAYDPIHGPAIATRFLWLPLRDQLLCRRDGLPGAPQGVRRERPWNGRLYNPAHRGAA